MHQERFSSVHGHCATCFTWKCTQMPDYITSCELIECDKGCGKIFHACKYSQHTHVCEAKIVQCINKEYGCCVEITKSKMAAHLLVCPANVVNCKRAIPNEEYFSGICDKTFRREEYMWHSRNAHADLNTGTMSLKCPLSCWECDFSCPKLTMENPPGHVTNSASHQCHAVVINRPCPEIQNLLDESGPYFEYLPDYVLEHIIMHLDSLSINCLSMTSKFLRSFCQSMLSKKGIVEPLWVRDENNDNKWKIQKLKWYYSTATTPIRKWQYHLSTPVSEHLKTCTFYLGRPEEDKVVPCENGCGLTMNKNKMNDHKNVCQFERISCVNKNGGCDSIVVRNKMAVHLLMCPANVLKCNSRCIPKESGECFRVFRKKELPGHQKLTHVDMVDQVSIPCPLVTQGCTFVTPRITPEEPKGKMEFTNTTKSWNIVRENDNVNFENRCHELDYPERNYDIPQMVSLESVSGDNNLCRLESLPGNLLTKIILQLDSLSLNHLSRTSSHLRSACHEVLPIKGVVEHVWEKTSDGWRTSQKKWYFSTACSPVQRWKVNLATTIAEHMKTCKMFKDRNIKTEKTLVMFDN